MNAMNHSDRAMMDKITENDAFDSAEVFFACMFADNEILKDCGLDAEDFGEPLHYTVFTEAMKLYQAHQLIDAVSLKPSIPRFIEKLEVSPAEYLSRLMIMGANPSVRSGLAAAIQIIKSVSLARRAAREAHFLSDLANEGHTLLTLDEEIEALENRLRETRQRLSALRSGVSAGALYLSAFNASAKRNGVVGVPIALPEIARVLSEPVMEAGNLYGLLSSSGEGKTSLTVQMVLYALEQGHPVCVMSYDQSAAQIIRQMIAQKYSIDTKQQRDPANNMTQEERDICVRFSTWIDQQAFEVIKCRREGIDRITTYARRFVKKYGNGNAPLIVLDHIGKVTPKDGRLSADRISGDITVEAKACAEETGSAWLVLNQRNGQGDKRDNPRPIAADLYGGTGARADYDAILYLYSAEKYKAEREKVAASDADWKKINRVFGADIEGIREIGVIKSRFGDPTLTENVTFIPRYTRYESSKQPDQQGRMF